MMRRRFLALPSLALVLLFASLSQARGETHRLYDGITAFVDNSAGGDFTLTVNVQDINYQSRAPSELLVKVYPPDGRPVVRELIADDGVAAPAYTPPVAGWDHEAFYYATCHARGIEPMMRWSTSSSPARLQTIPKRTLTYAIKGEQKGIYRVVLMGNPDLYVTLQTDPKRPIGVAGNPEWLHGHGTMFKRSFVYVPPGVASIHALFLQLDQPATRRFRVSDAKGEVLVEGDGGTGLARTIYTAPEPGALDGKILVVEVSEGPGDFLLNVTLRMKGEARSGRSSLKTAAGVTLDNYDNLQPWRGPQSVTAVLAPTAEAAKAMAGGSIMHDGRLFWQMHQVRLYDYLRTLKAEDFDYPKDLPQVEGFYSVGSHERPIEGRPGWGDRVMHDYSAHKNPEALNFALRDMFFGMRLIGPGDHVTIGPLSNLAYEMGCYAYFFPRPAWRILQQTDAPEAAKGPIREFVIQICDRLAMARGIELVNGNSLASLVQSLRYCVEATDDELNQRLYETFLQRFRSGGFGDRIGIGPSGGLQESFGYDFHYGSYVLRGWNAVRHDLKDAEIEKLYAGIMSMYSYAWSPVGSAPWNARTGLPKVAGGTYNSWHADPRFRWKGHGGPDLTDNVNGGNEWFAARRAGYYFLTYHGRLSPTWMGEGFHGQQGYGGGAICQLYIPGNGNGPVLGSSLNGSYGKGMHVSQWRNFHLHSIVGETKDGQPLVTANSEHLDARLEGDTVTSRGEVRQSSVAITRSYTYGPNSILCRASLEPAGADRLYAIWGGAPSMRGAVREAYEMIPFIDIPRGKDGKRRPGATRVTAIGSDNAEIGPLTEAGATAAAIVVDRDGFGARIQLESPKTVRLGMNNTVLIELANKLTPAADVNIAYRIIPYVGDPPETAESTARQLTIARVEAVSDAAALPAALAESEAHTLKTRKTGVAGAVRWALAGENLAVSVDVKEPRISRGKQPWQGSCVEVFGAMPGQDVIGQVFLLPALGDQPAKALLAAKGGNQEKPEVAVHSVTTETGYTLSALVPLAFLRLTADATAIRLECQITNSEPGKGKTKLQHTTLFGSVGAYEHSERYGVFEVE